MFSTQLSLILGRNHGVGAITIPHCTIAVRSDNICMVYLYSRQYCNFR